MNMIQYSLNQFFARDMVIKMQYTTCFDIARVQKVTVQYTSKYLVDDAKQSVLPSVALQLITNQTPTLIRAKQSVASFKLKEKQVIGCMVTLQKQKMYNFLLQCVHMHLPHVKHLKPFHISVNQSNVHFGIDQLLFFPPVQKHVNVFESLDGCSVHIHTNASKTSETALLCSVLKFPVTVLQKKTATQKKDETNGTS